MFIYYYVSVPQCQVRFWIYADTFWKTLLDIRLQYSVRSQSRYIFSCSKLFYYEKEIDWRSMFRKVRQCIRKACNSSEMEPYHPVKHHQVSSYRHATRSTDKAIHLATKSPALNSTPPPPPPNYKSIKLWYILIVFLLPHILYHRLRYSAPSFSSFPSPLSTFIFSFVVLFFTLPAFPPPSVSSHSIIISIIITSVITNINLHNQNLILLCVLLITLQSLSPTTILSHSALHPFSSPSTSYFLR